MQNTIQVEHTDALVTRTTETLLDEAANHSGGASTDDPSGSSWWKRNSTSPLFLAVIAFGLTTIGGLIGSGVTYYLSSSQAETQRKHSFVDEFNKVRINKLAEVWEKVYVYEAGVERVMEQVNVAQLGNNDGLGLHVQVRIPPGVDIATLHEQGERLHAELLDTLNKDRFWVLDEDYLQIKKYADTTYDYYLAIESGKVTQEQAKNRDEVRADLAKVQQKIWKEGTQGNGT